MQRTSNYQLPQWEKEDRILMEDFNGMTEKIDVNLAEAKSVADGAKTTAERAEGKADAAQTTADAAYCPDNKPYVTGTYSGTGKKQAIELGFKPAAVIVGEWISGSPYMGTYNTSIFFPSTSSSSSRHMSVTSTGFTVHDQSSGDNTCVNKSGSQYSYIALR